MRHRLWLPLVATCAALVSASSLVSRPASLSAWAQGGSQGSWSIRAPFRAAINEVAVVAVGNKVHVLGGSVLGVAGPYDEVYDPETDKWSARVTLPAAVDGELYIVAGSLRPGSAGVTNEVLVFYPAMTWA